MEELATQPLRLNGKTKKPGDTTRETGGPRLTTLATEVQPRGRNQGFSKIPLTSEDQGGRNNGSQVEVCIVCKKSHTI